MKFFIVLTLVFFENISYSQQFTTSISAEQTNTNPDMIQFGDSYYSLSIDMPKISGFSANLDRSIHAIEINKLSTAFAPVKSVKLSSGKRMYGPMYPTLKVVGTKLFLLYYKMFDEEDIKLYATEVNPVSLELLPEIEILNITEKEKYLKFFIRSINFQEGYRHSFKVVGLSGRESNTSLLQVSPDNSKIMVLWTSGWSNTVFYSVLDNNLKLLRTKTEEIVDADGFDISNGCIDNAGNVFLLINYEKNKKQKVRLLIHNSKSIATEVTLPEGDVSNVNIACRSNSDGNLYMAGTYKWDSYNLTGVFHQEYNVVKNKMENVSKTAFPADLIELLDKEGWASTKAKSYGIKDDFEFELLLNEDGTANLVSELRGGRSSTTTSVASERFGGGMTSSTKSWVLSGSIISINFGQKETRFSRIPKIRVSAGTTFGDSYKLIKHDKKLIVFYNDHKSNLERDISKAPERSDNYKNSVLAAAIISEDGSVKRTIVLDQSDENFLASTITFLKTAENAYTLLFYKIKGMGGVTEITKRATINIK